MNYVPHTDADRTEMLRLIGVETIDGLFAPIPDHLRLDGGLDLPSGLDETAVLRALRAFAVQNFDIEARPCFLGAGIYDHFVPSVVDTIVSRGEFLTAYTPYQPELSQGMLQVLYEFQSLVCRLTGMEMANASMYDGATALAEAALMAIDITGRERVVVSTAVHPHYRQVLQTYLRTAGYSLVEAPHADGGTDLAGLKRALDDRAACVVVQNPSFFGCLEDLGALRDCADAVGALTVVAADPIALGLLKPPGAYGADIVVGEGQALGVSPAFGGPLLGFFACRLAHQRKFPGRIVGATTDREGRRGYTMTLRTREQDIRREKASSNICTNETLLALAASVYLAALGKSGFAQVADACLQKAHYAQRCLAESAGVRPRFARPFFREFAVQLPPGLTPEAWNERLAEAGIVGGYALGRTYPELADSVLLSVTEKCTRADIDRLVDVTASAVGAA